MKKISLTIAVIFTVTYSVFPYGPRGHALVGRIADNRLALDASVHQKLKAILRNVTLEEAANLPDEIKGWDKCKSTENPSLDPVVNNTEINDELRAFLNANPCMGPGGHSYHRNFHFTNIPVVGNQFYDDGTVGRSSEDIVNVVTYCVKVLQGTIPEDNKHAITKAVAIILIAHHIGDIHQPLHVGAQYFDKNKQPFEPSPNERGFDDRGGNQLTLFTFQKVGNAKSKLLKAGKNMHSYWDGQTVDNAFGNESVAAAAQQLAFTEPDDWRLQGDVTTWSKQMANSIIPISREAHSRLTFKSIQIVPNDRTIVSGRAEEKKRPDKQYYARWALRVAREQVHKGGWRLAELLRRIL